VSPNLTGSNVENKVNNHKLKGKKMNPAALGAAMKGDIENALRAMTPGGIEQQEKEGQASLTTNSKLPQEMDDRTRELLESKGVVFGDTVDGIFLSCMLPAGWKIVPTDHSMWSHLIDENDNRVAAIFYKAAFYDRRAFMRIE
jgi:hypothetical protein